MNNLWTDMWAMKYIEIISKFGCVFWIISMFFWVATVRNAAINETNKKPKTNQKKDTQNSRHV